MTTAITFGTSGHRGITNQTFTTNQIIAIGRAIAEWLHARNSAPRLILGFDPRSGNDVDLASGSFTNILVRVLLQENVHVDVCQNFAPTPLISWIIVKKHYNGGLILTASHNPPQYNGIKFNPEDGAPAPSEVTRILEARANELLDTPYTVQESDLSQVSRVSYETEFVDNMLATLQSVMKLTAPSVKGLRTIIDSRHGTTGDMWAMIMTHLEMNDYQLINREPRSDFGGLEPNPTKPGGQQAVQALVRDSKAALGIANDPDGDRHVIIDDLGQVLTPEQTTVIILDYLMQHHVPVRGIATTVASSHLIKTALRNYHLQLAETGVGFKYFAPFLAECRQENMIGLAVESSGGFSTSFHTMEKCGFLPCLMIMMILADSKKKLSELVKAQSERYGQFVFLEAESHFEMDARPLILDFINQSDPGQIQACFANPVRQINKTDGLKIEFQNGSWLLLRLSGTEPVARLYVESATQSMSESLMSEGKQLLVQISQVVA